MASRMWHGCSFFSIDPGINHTGLAHYYINTTGQLSLRHYQAVSPHREMDDFTSTAYILDFLGAYLRANKPALVFLERPPNTIYHQGRATRAMLIARAQSVFKVIGVTYSVAMLLRNFPGVTTHLIDPVKWQERSRKNRGGLDIKDWSLKLANSLITQISNKPATLHTEREVNIADAISMGYISYQKLTA